MSRVVITGAGVVTSLGHNVSSTWNSLVKGESGVRRVMEGDPVLKNTKGFNLALVQDFDHNKWRIPVERL